MPLKRCAPRYRSLNSSALPSTTRLDWPTMTASASAALSDDGQYLVLRGDWTAGQLPDLSALVEKLPPASATLRVDLTDVHGWDARLSAKLLQLQRYADRSEQDIELQGAGAAQRQLLQLATAVSPYASDTAVTGGFLSLAGLRRGLGNLGDDLLGSVEFLGATTSALLRTLIGRGSMRRQDLINSFAQAGPGAIGIITLTSVLVGMILAYLGAAQLEQFGAAVYVADLVAIGMLREMGALMTAVVMAGRTGAAYAAELSTMQTNEEIDAIRTLGINPLEFLVVPRIFALVLMMPLLVIYADALGIVGGAIVAGGMGVTPLQYTSQLESAVSLTHFAVGMLKGLVFAGLIAIAGCRAGMSAGRNSEAVGRATTEAVVTAVVYLIVADAAINILCQMLDI